MLPLERGSFEAATRSPALLKPRALNHAGLLVVLGLVAGPGCDRPPATGTALPPLLPADTSVLEPAVREQISAARAAVAANPASPEANGALGAIFHAYGWLEQAEVCYRRAAILDPAAFRWGYCLGRVLVEKGERDEGLDLVRRAAALREDYVPAALFLGEQAFQDENLDEARRWIGLASKLSPRSPHVLDALGQIAFKEGKTEEAIRRYREAIDLVPRFGRACYGLALAYRAAGDLESSARYLERHSSSDKLFPPADPILEEVRGLRRDADRLFRAANALLEQKKYAEAARRYEEVLQLNPALVMAEYNIGLAFQFLGEHEKAAEHYDAVLRQRPDSIDALNNLGLCFYDTGRFREAMTYIQRAVAIDPGYAKGHFNLGLASIKTGRLEEAVGHFETALGIRPRDAESHWNLGILQKQAGKREEAMAHFLQVLEIRPDDERAQRQLLAEMRNDLGAGAKNGPPENVQESPEARHRLAGLLKTKGLYRAAVSVLERGPRREDQGGGRTAVELAWLLSTCPDAAIRRPEEAVGLVEPLCLEAAREDPRAFDTLAAAQAAAGRFEDAVRAAETALRLAGASSPTAAQRTEGIRARLKLYQERKPYLEP